MTECFYLKNWDICFLSCSGNPDGLTSSKVFTEAMQPKLREISHLEGIHILPHFIDSGCNALV